MFLMVLFVLIMFWVVGYSPFMTNSLQILKVGDLVIGFREVVLFASTFLLAFTIQRPFRDFALWLILAWTLPLVGFTFPFNFSTTFLVAGITVLSGWEKSIQKEIKVKTPVVQTSGRVNLLNRRKYHIRGI